MKESDVTRDFKRYLEEHKQPFTYAYELKLQNEEKSKSFAFSRVAQHQIDGLKRAKKGMWFKIPDTAAINGFSSQKPFDGLWIKANDACVVVVYYKPRKYKRAVMIPIDVFCKKMNEHPRKSIRQEEWYGIDYVWTIDL